VASQTQVLERWPDGSVRWAVVDFQANAPASYAVSPGPTSGPANGVDVALTADGARAESGGLVFELAASGGFRLSVRPNAGGDERTGIIELTRADGVCVQPTVLGLDWELKGALRSVLRVDASADAGNGRVLEFVIRLHFFARLQAVRFDVAIRNPDRADHPGGYWELGDAGSILIRDCSLRIAAGTAASARCSVTGDEDARTWPVPFELYQDSSGGQFWKSPVHVNRDGIVPLSFRGFRVRAGGEALDGDRATPVLVIEDGDAVTAVAMRHFWQNFPKSLEFTGTDIVLRLFPRQFADLHEIQGGEQKTHTFHVGFGQDVVSALPLDWARRPAFAAALSSWYCGADAAPYLTPFEQDPNRDYVDLLRSVIEGPHSFTARREVIDEYGWRNFGEIYADHEAVFHKGEQPLVSHYNNQYDGIAGFAYQFFRSGDPRWWWAMDELAQHVRDIDIYHTQQDKSAYSGGLFWHTYHYVDAGKCTHRSYPRAKGVDGGGPANEQSYSTGLMLHYLLTGDVASRDAAVELAEWVLALDDGTKTPFRWLSRGDTGLASKTHSMDYHGPGRGAGNAAVVLLNGYRLTGRREFLDKAEALIRRCIHPQDDIAARNLLDSESRWSYTVFLQMLGRYLDEKAIRNELDERYAYARESLLHYARWMSANEYLYLDKPEQLEYPTETWAAQDMRKSDVFKFAAKHSAGAERERFLERSRYFFAGSMRMLLERPTRFTARPRVLMMICGFMDAAFAGGFQGVSPAGPSVGDSGRPKTFVPQKPVAMRRAKLILGAAGGTGLAAAAALLAYLL
jgi:hypothetical protein